MPDGSQPSFEARRRSFGERASEYDAFRPTYAPAALDWMVDGSRRVVREIADVGAGTGILTRQLLERGFEVIAVEPDERMLEHLGFTAPSARRVCSSAESIELPDDSCDALCVGQAFHWFDEAKAVREFTRIVRPGGVVSVLTNVRDERVDWLREIGRIVGGAEWNLANLGDVTEQMKGLFPSVVRGEFANDVMMTPDEVLGLVRTFSYVRLRDDAKDVERAVREVLGSHEATAGRARIIVPYVTVVFRSVLPGKEL